MLYVKSPCGPCCGSTPTVTAGACVSRQGNGTLCGWSKIQNHNAGDVNLRKYRTKTFFGEMKACRWTSGCAALGTTAEGVYWNKSFAFSGCSLPSPSTQVFDGYRLCSGGNAFTAALGYYEESLDPEAAGANGWYTSANYVANITRTLADARKTDVGSGSCFAGSGVSVALYGTAGYDLLNPDTVHDALGRGSPTVGSSCRTTAGTIGTTAAESTTAISLTGTRSVRVPLACAALIAGTDYIVTVEIDRYTAGGGSYVDTITDTITFTASGATEDIDYDVPVNTDYDYEYAGNETIAAV